MPRRRRSRDGFEGRPAAGAERAAIPARRPVAAMTAVFVTATGTDVGKTYVTSLLACALRAAGRRVHALKPVATGFDPARVEESDAGRLLRICGMPIDPATLDEVSPWRFNAALSPDMAAARERRTIDWTALLAYSRRAVAEAQRRDAALLIEGIGGVMVPLGGRRTVLDWIAALDIPVLLVAGSYLGTLSHTLTAAGMLAARGCRLAGVVVDESADQPVGADETAAALQRLLAPTPVVVVPREGASTNDHAAAMPRSAASLAAAARLVELLDAR